MSMFNDSIVAEGIQYIVGTNDGRIHKKAIFVGKKMLNGKEWLCFKMHKTDKPLTVNPSYMTFALEDDMEMNDVIYKQGIEAWEGDKADGKTNNETSRRNA